MRGSLFVDTSGWIANFVDRDQHHEKARRFVPLSLREYVRFITTDYVFDEAVTRVRFQGGHQEAVQLGEVILTSKTVTLLEIGSRLREKAWHLFRKYADQRLSFTDCTTLAVMNLYGLRDIFTFDQDFERLGYRRLPGRP